MLRAGALLPYSFQLPLGRRLGRTLAVILPRRRHIAEVNLALCLPELGPEAREALLRASFESLGIAFLEVALAWWAPAARLRPLVQVEGLANLAAALAEGKGALLLSAHFTTLEIGGRLLQGFQPFRPIYRPTKNPLWDWAMLRSRERHVERAIDRQDVRAVLRALRANEPVWYAPDQDYGREHSVFVPFFGVPAATITATSRLAAMSGAPVVPFFQVRLPDARGYLLRIEPALADFPSGDPAADAARVNALIEARVREHPEQYLWSHRRFKTRPAGSPPVYD
jgi:KDO2-lipid IV(A) lauroyltransferase